MTHPRITVGLHVPPKPPAFNLRALVYAARAMRLESLTVWDHFQDLFPEALWDKRFSWLATQSPTPHDMFDYQVILGYLAARAGRLRIGVNVTEAVRRHPVLIAQSMMTLAHLTKRPPILGMGTGERENTEPYGLSTAQPVGRLEEALQIIRRCFASHGPIDFQGKHFQLEGARMDLQPPKGRTPEIWVAAHGPRMLRLTGTYADVWLPVLVSSPDDYAAKLGVVHSAARDAGRNPDAIRPALHAYAVVAPSEREAREMLSAKAVRFIAVLAPAEMWRQHGVTHPLGDDFRGFFDFVPEHHTRQELDEAIASVPVDALAETLIWGTPEQVANRIRAFGEVGVRHVNLELVSAVVSRRAALNSLRGLRAIAQALR